MKSLNVIVNMWGSWEPFSLVYVFPIQYSILDGLNLASETPILLYY